MNGMLTAAGHLAARRRDQQVAWTWEMIMERLLTRLSNDPQVRAATVDVERQVCTGELTPTLAADRILEIFLYRRLQRRQHVARSSIHARPR